MCCASVATWALVASVCVSVVSMVSGQPEPSGHVYTVDAHDLGGRNDGSVYCGSRLSDALKLMCNGEYNSYFKSKKTLSPPEDEYWAPPVQLPFRERLRAAAFLESRTRFTRGVIDECCRKSCTVDELMSYCLKKT